MTRVGLFITLFFISGALYFWNPFWSIAEKEPQPQATTLQPDFVADDLALKRYDEQGFLSSQVQAEHMEHFQEIGLTKFTAPNYLIYPKQGEVRWRVRADEGTFNHRNHVVLKKNVIIMAISPDELVKEIKTSYLELDLNTRMMTSDRPVTVFGKEFTISGIGLEADLNRHYVELKKDIRATYDNTQS